MNRPNLEDTTRYVWGNFLSAKGKLVAGDANLRQRVHNAFVEIGPSFDSDVPAEFREELVALRQSWGELATMEDAEVESIALRICRFADDLTKVIESSSV